MIPTVPSISYMNEEQFFILAEEVPCETLKCLPLLFSSQPHGQKAQLAESIQEWEKSVRFCLNSLKKYTMLHHLVPLWQH